MRRQANITVYLGNIIIVRRASQVRSGKNGEFLPLGRNSFFNIDRKKKGGEGKEEENSEMLFESAVTFPETKNRRETLIILDGIVKKGLASPIFLFLLFPFSLFLLNFFPLSFSSRCRYVA